MDYYALFVVFGVVVSAFETNVTYDPGSQTLRLNISLLQDVVADDKQLTNLRLDLQQWSNSSNCSIDDGPFIAKRSKEGSVGDRCPNKSSENHHISNIRSKRVCFHQFDHEEIDDPHGFAISPWIYCDQFVSDRTEHVEVVFHYVYTGCYCFRMETYVDDNIRSAKHLTRGPLLLQTDAIDPDVFHWNVSLDLSAVNERDMKLFIRLMEPRLDFLWYHVELFQLDDDDLVSLNGCQLDLSDHLVNDHVLLDGPSLASTSFDEFSVTWVNFANRTRGYYCVVVVPEDERCHARWLDDKRNRTCQRHSNMVYMEGSTKSDPLFVILDSGSTAWWSAGLAVLALLALLVVFLILWRRLRPLAITTNFPTESIPTKCEGGSVPSLLLFYSHQNDRLVRRVRRMKEQLSTLKPCPVIYDDIDDDLGNVEGSLWFQNRLMETRNLRVLVFSSPEMIRCQQFLFCQPYLYEAYSKQQTRLCSGKDCLSCWAAGEDRLDLVCLHRLNQLLYDLANFSDPYHRAFVIEFDEDESGHHSHHPLLPIVLLTPYRSYRWPADRDQIFLLAGQCREVIV